MRLMNSARLKGGHASNPDLYAAELRHDRVIALMGSIQFSPNHSEFFQIRLSSAILYLPWHPWKDYGCRSRKESSSPPLPTNATALWTAFVQKWGNQPGCGPVWTRSVVWARAMDFVGKGIAVPDA